MTTKKTEVMELENTVLEEAVAVSQENTELEITVDPDSVPQEETKDMDLNELLGSMDADPEDETLPATDEDEAFTAELLAELGEDTDVAPFSSHKNVGESSKGQESPAQEEMAQMEAAPEKPKRAARRKKAETAVALEDAQKDTPEEISDIVLSDSQKQPSDAELFSENTAKEAAEEDGTTVSEAPTDVPVRSSAKRKQTEAAVLTIVNRDDVETESAKEDAIWHEIHNAYRTRKIMTGQLGGIEQMDNGKTIAIVDYKGFRIIIPLKEMMINLGRNPFGQEYVEFMH